MIFPFAVKGAISAAGAGATVASVSAAAAATSAAKAAVGPFAAIVLVVEVSIVRGIQIAKNEEARQEFEAFRE